MKWADVRFYSELNDFLRLCRRSRTTSYAFDVSGSVKDMIEALGVPHTEVDLVLANGQSVDFSYRVQNGDRISVYPGFEAIDISPLVWLRPQPLRVLRFVADTHLGRLTAYLRMVGFDTLYRSDYPDEELGKISSNEKRILLTRDRGLLKRNIVTRGYCVRTMNPRQQLVEVLQRFDLSGSIAPFQRCVHCNVLLQPVRKELMSEGSSQRRSNITTNSVSARGAIESTGKAHTFGACSDSSRALLSVKSAVHSQSAFAARKQ